MAKSKKKTAKRPIKNPNGDGRFKKGNTASKGTTSPQAKTRVKLADAFKSAITESDMISIAKAMVAKAKKGDTKAAECVLNRCLGKPIQPITGEDGGAVQVQVNIVGFEGMKLDDTQYSIPE